MNVTVPVAWNTFFFFEKLIRQIHLYIATHQVSSPTKAPLFPKLPKWLHSYIVTDTKFAPILVGFCFGALMTFVSLLGLVEEVFPVGTDTNPFSRGHAHWAAWRPRTMMRRDIILPHLTFSFYLFASLSSNWVVCYHLIHLPFSSSFQMLWCIWMSFCMVRKTSIWMSF